jgi:translation initiation factor 3 subunit G
MKVHPSVIERRKWKKYGESYGLEPGPDANSTTFGESVFMQWIQNSKEEVVETQKVSISILCRICKGNHFSSKCPYKDTYAPLDALETTIENAKEANSSTASAGGKYVPPSLRSRGPGETMPAREQLPTIRITNLSEEATEMDVRSLVSRFGHPSRVFVARDRDLNVCKGFAFVSYPSREMAAKALAALNGYGYDNLILKVEWSIKE